MLPILLFLWCDRAEAALEAGFEADVSNPPDGKIDPGTQER